MECVPFARQFQLTNEILERMGAHVTMAQPLRGSRIPSRRVPAWAQVMHFPEEDFFDAEADDVTVCDPVERDAEPQAFLILVNPVTGQSSDVDHLFG